METCSRKGSGLVVVLAAVMATGLVSSGATAHADCGRPANAIEAENCLPGDLASPWDASPAARSSVNRGETISFRVGAAAADRIDVYRLGDYQGAGARLVTTLADASTEWAVPADAVSGIYVARRAGEGARRAGRAASSSWSAMTGDPRTSSSRSPTPPCAGAGPPPTAPWRGGSSATATT